MIKKEHIINRRVLMIGAAVVIVAAGSFAGMQRLSKPPAAPADVSSQSRKGQQRYVPSTHEWASLTVEPVSEKTFRSERVTEGKIAIDEDRSTPVFSPYAGRVTKLLSRPGDRVKQGDPLLVIEATDTVSAQNDFITALSGVNKAQSQLDLAQLGERRAKNLLEGKAAPLKDYEQAQATLIGAQNDVRASQTALQAARNKLRILGLGDQQISTVQNNGSIDPDTTVLAPIAGTVVQRKVGPGQFIAASAADPVFVIGDLSTVWLTAFVRETEAASIEPGQELSFEVLALPGRKYTARIGYVAAAIDPSTRRLLVRATIDNTDRLLKPEMFASVTIFSGGDRPAIGVPKQALIYEANEVRVWVVNDDKSIELRKIRAGLATNDLVEVTNGLARGERIVTRGSLFIDRAASGS